MIIVNKITTAACCGKTQTSLEINTPLLKEYLQLFIDANYIVNKSYLDAGIFCVEDAGLVAICPYGSNRIQIKCKNSECAASINILEAVLYKISA